MTDTSLHQELEAVLDLPDFDRFERLWNLLIRVGLSEFEPEEGKRAFALLKRLSGSAMHRILNNSAVEELIELNPPLETVLAAPHERLRSLRAQRALDKLRRCRTERPAEALHALATLLKLIRDKRIHGFKTPHGPRDNQILRPASGVLRAIVEEVLEESTSRTPRVNESSV